MKIDPKKKNHCSSIITFILKLYFARKFHSKFRSKFRKKTHTKQYLHASSYHFPAQKLGVLNTLATCALRIFDETSFEEEKSHLLNVFVEKDYSRQLGQKAFLKETKNSLSRKEPKDQIPGVHLPYVQGTWIGL